MFYFFKKIRSKCGIVNIFKNLGSGNRNVCYLLCLKLFYILNFTKVLNIKICVYMPRLLLMISYPKEY